MNRVGERGFSLIEVVVAFASLALVLAVYLSVSATAARTELSARDKATGQIHAARILAEAGVTLALSAEKQSGQFEDRWRWIMTTRTEAQKAVGPKGDLVLTRITLVIETAERRPVHQVETSRLIRRDTGLVP